MKRILMTLSLLAMSFSASAMVIYQNDFESGDTSGWSGGEIVNGVYVQKYSNGFFGIGAGWKDIDFDLASGDIGPTVDLMFDVITYGDWEQSGSAKDEFEATSRIIGLFNDVEIFSGTLNDGVNSMMISDVPSWLSINGLGGILSLKFEADTTASSEYFGLDNFKVLNGVVAGLPEPGTLVIFLMGLAGIAATRRRAR